MLALTFDSPTDEAAWICDRIERLRGVPFTDAPEAQPRGLSWSDFAVLFRSVSKDAGAAGRRAAAAVDPVRDQGADPAVRRTRGTGVRRPASSTSCTRWPPTTS